jgi:hypothetical protein
MIEGLVSKMLFFICEFFLYSNVPFKIETDSKMILRFSHLDFYVLDFYFY